MSDRTNSSNGLISQLVVKAIERKKTQEQVLIDSKKPKLEYVLFSQFDVLNTLPSKNGNTTVYHLAKHGETHKQVCCKVLNENANDLARDMLLNEARRLKISQHPNIAKFIRSGNEFGRPYLMSEWIPGESLAEKILHSPSKGFRPDHVAWFIYQLAGAIDHMHALGLCHLDIKPSNIIICDDDSVKLIDFGAARYIDKPEAQAEASLKYVSPLYLASGIAKPQDDIYSLALLTGHFFLAGVFGNAWHLQLTCKKRPLLIPAPVWRLIKQVILKPRTHKYTAISFAQELLYIEREPIKVNNKTPIFKHFNHADFVPAIPTPSSASPLSFLTSKYLHMTSKYLHMTWMSAVLLLVLGYFLQKTPPPIIPAKPDIVMASEKVNLEQIASFLAQSPWDQKNMLTRMSNDISRLAPYQKALQSQENTLSQRYKEQENSLISQHSSTKKLMASLTNIRANLITLKEILKTENQLTSSAEQSLITMMDELNRADTQFRTATQYLSNNDEELAKWLLTGNADAVDNYLKRAWENHQANAYFYSRALSNKILDLVIVSANNDAQKHRHSIAIKNIETAMLFLGEHPDLRQKIIELTIARSEYILFSTVTEKSIFSPQKLSAALHDLKANSPEKFDEAIALLNNIITENIKQSYKKSKPANGALAVQRALHDYNKQAGTSF